MTRYGRMTGHGSVELAAVLRQKMKNEVGKITWVPIAEVTLINLNALGFLPQAAVLNQVGGTNRSGLREAGWAEAVERPAHITLSTPLHFGIPPPPFLCNSERPL